MKRYRRAPRTAFRRMGLGVEKDGYVRVVAGFRFQWWNPFEPIAPIVVSARILRKRAVPPVEAQTKPEGEKR